MKRNNDHGTAKFIVTLTLVNAGVLLNVIYWPRGILITPPYEYLLWALFAIPLLVFDILSVKSFVASKREGKKQHNDYIVTRFILLAVLVNMLAVLYIWSMVGREHYAVSFTDMLAILLAAPPKTYLLWLLCVTPLLAFDYFAIRLVIEMRRA